MVVYSFQQCTSFQSEHCWEKKISCNTWRANIDILITNYALFCLYVKADYYILYNIENMLYHDDNNNNEIAKNDKGVNYRGTLALP